jgi:hypothetical protein
MKARINFTIGDNDDAIEDSFVLDGSPEEIREQAEVELAKRGGINPWSEVLEVGD